MENFKDLEKERFIVCDTCFLRYKEEAFKHEYDNGYCIQEEIGTMEIKEVLGSC